MSDTVIRVENLSKRYRIGTDQARYGSLRDSLVGAITAPLRRLGNSHNGSKDTLPGHIWALKDVSFEVKQGEVVGIIGRNGAGKSTLLKILSRITRPTQGQVRIMGRVGSLLEVGTGFHPELTGRENIYLNGAILGMQRGEIEHKFDEIVDFAEIEQFLDTPVKHYSSGMYMRLAFAVAAHLEPEILLVDEVLAVGDIAFQKKCLGKMGEVAEGGRTVLFVSHNMAAINTLCQKGIYLNRGEVNYLGEASSCISEYIASIEVEKKSTINFLEDTKLPVQLISLGLVNKDEQLVNTHPYNEPFGIRLEIAVRSPIAKVYISAHIHDNTMSTILFSRDFEYDKSSLLRREPGIYTYIIEIPKSILVPGTYYISIHIAKSAPPQLISGVDYICPFEIIDSGSIRAETGFPWVGKVAVALKWKYLGRKPLHQNLTTSTDAKPYH